MSKGMGRKLDFADRPLRNERAIGEHLDGTALDPSERDQRNPRPGGKNYRCR
jgi:hypothetical protein